MKLTDQQKLHNRKTRLSKRIQRGGNTRGATTIKIYVSKIVKLFELLYPNKPFTGYQFVNRQPNKIAQLIENMEIADSSKVTYLSALLSLYKDDDKGIRKNGKAVYQRMFDKYRKRIEEKYEKQEKNDKEEDKWLSKRQIEDGRKKLLSSFVKSNDQGDFYRYLIMSLYTLLPPRRGMSYGSMRINPYKRDNWQGNVVIKRAGKFQKFIFREFKLCNKKGEESFDRAFMKSLPRGDEIIDLLDTWLTMNKTKWFLTRSMSSNAFPKLVSRIAKYTYGKPVNINMWRKMYVTRFLGKNPFLDENKKVTAFMSHSMATQQLVYRKKPDNLDEQEDEKAEEVKGEEGD